MKIKKTLFSTEIEISPSEIDAFWFNQMPGWLGIMRWVKEKLGLNLAEVVRKHKVK